MAWHLISKDHNTRIHCRENLKFHVLSLYSYSSLVQSIYLVLSLYNGCFTSLFLTYEHHSILSLTLFIVVFQPTDRALMS
jgi:hypothetical protein